MHDPAIVELCKRIYQKHRAAIDLINELGVSTRVGDTVKEFLQDQPDSLRILASLKDSTWFVPEAWVEHLRAWGPGWKHLDVRYPVTCWVSHPARGEKVGIIVEVGPMEPAETRQCLVRTFAETDFGVRESAFRDEAQFTRVFTCYRKVLDFDDGESVLDALKGLWDKAGPAIKRAGEVLRTVSAAR